MVESVTIPIANLRLDSENPRLSTPNSGQRETFREMAKLQGPKLGVMAQDIVEYGLDPSELTIVTSLEGESDRFVVLDGNRRLTAIKALENPELAEGVVAASVLRSLRKLSKTYHEDPIEEIACVVTEDRDAARHWLELRHTGERGGAGSVLWGSQESARFRSRTGDVEPHMQALDFLQRRGDLSPERRNQIAATTFRRLLGTPYVRERLGVEVVNGTLRTLADEQAVAAALLHVADDVADGQIKVRDVYTVDQRMQYADRLPGSVVPRQIRELGAGVPIGNHGTELSEPRRRPTRAPKPRERLIPGDCVLDVSEPRLRYIRDELVG